MRTSTWIELRSSLFWHPKTLKMVDALNGADKHKVVGHLAQLWCWAIDHAPDGDLSHLPPEAIERAADWKTRGRIKAGEFVSAMKVAGFLGPDNRIHDWGDYAGRLIDKRKRDAARKKAERGGTSGVIPLNVRRTS